ncbi:hypothetical protein ACOSP7_019811 [Xanthoceras sorbifolium]
MFTATLWYVWKWRCSSVFDDNFNQPSCPALIISRFCKDWLMVNENPSKTKSVRDRKELWKPPEEGETKINVDGGRDTVTGTIYTGGVLRNSRGSWLGGFSSNKGIGSVLEAELWAALEGLHLAWSSGYRSVILESDSADTVKLLLKDSNINHPLFNLISECRKLIKSGWNCEVKHILREGNMVADFLAGLGKHRELGTGFHPLPPPDIASLIELDAGNFFVY